jgi:hypothetical protein
VIDASDALEEEENVFGDWRSTESTEGVNWRHVWSRGFSDTSLSHSVTIFDTETFETRTGDVLLDTRSVEHEVRLRNVNRLALGAGIRAETGVEASWTRATYDTLYAATTDPLGGLVPVQKVDETLEGKKAAGFLTLHWQPIDGVTVSPGVRIDHFSLESSTRVSPRAALTIALGRRTAVRAAGGLYRQSLPLVLLAQNERHRRLRGPTATHLVAGLQHLLADDTRLTIEAYDKRYRDFPMDPTQPQLFVIDEIVYGDAGYRAHEQLVDAGAARARGIELAVHKRLARRLYGLVGGAVFRAEYRGLDDVWRDRVFDNRYRLTVEGGYKFNESHELGVRWISAGRSPYTPFDAAASATAGTGILDASRVNAKRRPAYHSLNLRYDRRFHFARSSLIVYVSVWNVLGRRNIARYEWNEVANEPRVVEQWGTLPIVGVEWEF